MTVADCVGNCGPSQSLRLSVTHQQVTSHRALHHQPAYWTFKLVRRSYFPRDVLVLSQIYHSGPSQPPPISWISYLEGIELWALNSFEVKRTILSISLFSSKSRKNLIANHPTIARKNWSQSLIQIHFLSNIYNDGHVLFPMTRNLRRRPVKTSQCIFISLDGQAVLAREVCCCIQQKFDINYLSCKVFMLSKQQSSSVLISSSPPTNMSQLQIRW